MLLRWCGKGSSVRRRCNDKVQVVNDVTFGERFTVGDIVSSGDRGGGHLSGKAPRSKRVTNTINWLCVFYCGGM